MEVTCTCSTYHIRVNIIPKPWTHARPILHPSTHSPSELSNILNQLCGFQIRAQNWAQIGCGVGMVPCRQCWNFARCWGFGFWDCFSGLEFSVDFAKFVCVYFCCGDFSHFWHFGQIRTFERLLWAVFTGKNMRGFWATLNGPKFKLRGFQRHWSMSHWCKYIQELCVAFDAQLPSLFRKKCWPEIMHILKQMNAPNLQSCAADSLFVLMPLLSWCPSRHHLHPLTSRPACQATGLGWLKITYFLSLLEGYQDGI